MIVEVRTIGNRSTVTFYPHPLNLLVWIAAMGAAFVAGAGMAVLILL